MVVLCFGDIFGKPGRQAVRAALPALRSQYKPDFIIGNAENLAGGRGVNRKTFQEMTEMGFDVLTSGNHIWDNKDVYPLFESTDRLIRPANFPELKFDPCPGKGWTLVRNQAGLQLAVVNLMGRVFMDALDCPFRTVDSILQEIPGNTPVIVDMHADATSEKVGMGWYLDGRVAGVYGTHSHVQTADEQILPRGTAFISDIGMSGAFHSIIGMETTAVLKRFVSKRRVQVLPAKDHPGIGCVIIHIGPNGRATSIKRLRYEVENAGPLEAGDLE